MPNKYADPTLQTDSFTNLPVPSFNKIFWRSGDSRLSPLLGTDPGQYLGEFRSMVEMPATKDREAIVLPVLPWPVMKRKSGRETYSRYSATEMYFRPIVARLRYVLYERDATGQKMKGANGRDVILAITKTFVKGSGYSPQKEVFGIVFNQEGKFQTYAMLEVDSWSSFISYDKAAREFEKITAPDDKLVIYHLGTRGVKDADGEITPKTKTFNGGESVDIEALDLDKPLFMDVDKDFDDLWNDAQTWAKCTRWNAETKKAKQEVESTEMTTFLEAALTMGLTDAEVAKIVEENKGNYVNALASIQGDVEPEFMRD